MSTQGENWAVSKERADLFYPSIVRVLSEVFSAPECGFEEASPEEDSFHNKDVVNRSRGLDVSCRVREPDTTYLARYAMPGDLELLKYKNQCTIRSLRPSGNETELSKMLSGKGTHSFYAFGNEDLTLWMWVVLDLSEVRRQWSFEWVLGTKTNKDGSSSFVIIDLFRLPSSCILATSDNHPLRARKAA